MRIKSTRPCHHVTERTPEGVVRIDAGHVCPHGCNRFLQSCCTHACQSLFQLRCHRHAQLPVGGLPVLWLCAVVECCVVEVVCLCWMYGVHLVVYSLFLGFPVPCESRRLSVFTLWGLGAVLLCFRCVLSQPRCFRSLKFPMSYVSDGLYRPDDVGKSPSPCL